MYAYCLRNVVEPYAQIEDTAYVWLCPTSGITSVASAKDFVNPDTYFSLKIVTPLLETLLNKHLPSVLNDSLEAVEWGVGTRCQGCEFESGCTSRAFATGDVSLVGGTKGKERSALKEIIRLFRTRNRTKMKPITFPDVTAGKWNDWWTEVRWDRLGPIDFGRSDLADLYAAIQSPDFNSVLQQMNPTALQQGYKLLCLDRSSVRNDSPILKAVLENSVEVLGRPCFMFPPSEDHAINFSVLHDPETDSVIAISILHCSENRVLFSKVLFGRDLSKQFIPIMASRIRFILSQSPVPSAQFYVFSTKERDLVFSILLDGFNETTTDDLQLCFAAMLDQTDVLLAPIVPPLLISKEKLIGSLGNKSKLDLQWYLRVLENAASTKAGTKESLQTEIKSIIKDGIDPVWMPRIAVISTAIRSTLALPVSRLTMTNTVALLNNTNNNVLSSDDMYTLWKTGELMSFEKAMFEWSSAIHEICNSIRTRISESFNLQKVLVNSLPPFSVSRLDICREPLLSRLLFQTQFEMVKEFQSVKEARFDKFEACEVEYQRPHEGFVQQFLIRSDTSLIQASMNRNTSDFKMYSWILADSLVDAAIKFNDLRFMNQVEYGLSFSEEEKRETLNSVAFAEINSLENDMAQIELRMPKGFALRGRKFFLYRRFVDFNTHKVVQGLINTEITALARLEREELRPLFLRLLGETSATSLRVSSANDDLQVEAQLFEKYQGGPLHLLESQRQAFQGVCKNVLSLIWGPPGNGKTHTLAVSALRLIEIAKIRGRTCRILMTAFTHAAISTFETKFTHLLSLSEYSSGDVTVVNLKQDPNNLIQQKHCVVVGTVWAIHKLLDKSPKLKGDFDVLVVDEGSQLLTSYASIAFQAVDSSLNLDQKRVLIAGDHLQLGPILKQPYPIPKATRPIYGSILSCLIHKNESLTYMLRENFRFVRELCDMVQPLYVDYGQAFAPYNSNQTMVKEAIGQWLESPNGDMEALMRASFESPWYSLMVSDMVLTFHSCAPNARIFVITPHRLQRTIIQNTLELHLQTAQSDLLRIDTVERMQGDQADIVIACYGFTGHRQMLENEIEFIFDIHRVNVALSRSKALCILVASKNLFQPSAGLSHFKRFKDASAIVDWK
ncbi:P-loop containing nucleoside triphosphate hydrolase protein [Rhizoclosmatium globosum]|uniref:p-loop containing nucleoside triphosphate hydrolase protein n=1 Tax=Rhizoclosmatium globosum TaxID=329046 RepID=A0A1Y2CQ04_9FUNG|nr:P-loop containing nucleoside triphosphate hydrolase protein [Rhizoclosmatium globosum]|eukprot:ORY49037.1 P-loop containing nucleoside triphosphate hydrolase protein [Rhizoclosmatium globosum]